MYIYIDILPNHIPMFLVNGLKSVSVIFMLF